MKTIKKISVIFAGILLMHGGNVNAYITSDFAGWPALEGKSHDIIIARCSATPDLSPVGTNGVAIDRRGLIYSEIQIVAVLKGTNNFGTGQLVSSYWPRQGEYYLIFSDYRFGSYLAYEAYRIVPIGMSFSTDELKSGILDYEITTLLRRRLDKLNRQMSIELDEKHRLEEGLKEP